MTEVFIDHDGVERVAQLLGRLDEDATACRAHVLHWCDLSFRQEGIFWYLYQPHSVAFDRVAGSLRTAALLGAAFQTNIRQVAQQLRQANELARVLIDDAFPHVVTIPTVPGVVHFERPWLPDGQGSFRDVAEPQNRLVPPIVSDTRNEWQYNWVVDLLSPTAFIRWAIQKIFHKDVLAELLTILTGDWDAYRRCAEVWHQIDGASTDMATNLFRTAKELPLVWRGWAPTSLEWALIAIAQAFDNLAEECRYYTTSYRQAAEAAKMFFEGITPLLEIAIDSAILAMIAAEVGSALWETGVGLIGGFAVAAFYINRAIRVLQEAYDELQKFVGIVQMMAAAQTAYQSHQTWQMPELIDGPRFQVIEHD
jgi:hypothetical protein